MRILYWIGQMGDKFGSVERYNILLAEKCRGRGFEVAVAHDRPNTQPTYVHRLEAAEAQLIVIGDTYRDTRRAIVRAARFVRTWKPDVVHIHFVNPLVLPVLKLLGVPLVYKTWHTSIDHPIRARTRFIRVLCNHTTTRTLGVSERVVLDEIRAGARPNHVRRLYLGIPMNDVLNSSQACDQPVPKGFNGHDKIIITVGRFDQQKGMPFVAEAAVQVLNKYSELIWWLVGREGPETRQSVDIVKRACLEERILFLGQRNDVPALMGRAYLHVVGSIYEGLGLMALEASAFGIPTVGTRIGGLDEAVLDGVTGLLVPRRSAAELAEATLRLIEDPILRDQLGRSAKEHVLAHFDSDYLIDELLDMYEVDRDAKIP